LKLEAKLESSSWYFSFRWGGVSGGEEEGRGGEEGMMRGEKQRGRGRREEERGGGEEMGGES
jgi:hypothetical protein